MVLVSCLNSKRFLRYSSFCNFSQPSGIPTNDACILGLHNAALPLNSEDVMKRLKKEHYRIWKTIGAELGIDVDTLSAIEKDHKKDKDCLCAMIDSANPAPTHEVMAKILQSTNIISAIAGMMMMPHPTPYSLPPPPIKKALIVNLKSIH